MSIIGGHGPEVLEGGSGRPSRFGAAPGQRAGPGALTVLARRHRRAVTVVTVLAVAAAVLGYSWYENRPSPLPAISVSADRSADSVPLWSPGSDGRPSSPLTLSVSTSLADLSRRADGQQVTPVGLSGPGMSSPGAFPHLPLTGSPTSVELTGQVACDRVPIPLPGGAYTILLRVADGTRTRMVSVPLGDADPALTQRVTVGCSTWLAARDVTLVQVSSVRVDPVRPHVDLVVDVINRGAVPAVVWTQATSGEGLRVTSVARSVAAHSQISVAVSVDLDQCWTWDDSSPLVTTQATPLQMQAAAGLTRPIPADQMPLNQPGASVVLAPAAAQQLRDAFVQACGGVNAMVLLSDSGGATYDPRTHRMTVRMMVDTPPGTVAQLRLMPSKNVGSDLVPQFTQSPWLVPDPSGQVSYVVSFGVPPGVPCLGGGPFVALDVVARTAASAGAVRTIRFSLTGETFLPAEQIQAACTTG